MIKVLSLEEALSYDLFKENKVIESINKTKIIAVIDDNDFMTSFVEISPTMTERLKGFYSLEIINHDFKNIESFEIILQYFKEKYSPSDYFINLSPALKDANLEFDSEQSVYRYIDYERTYYLYKISSLNSPKYYYGVSHVKKKDASLEDCLNDGYYGSGGGSSTNKFNNWKKKYIDSLHKEILQIFERKAIAFNQEKTIVGDLYKTDRDCLNSIPGGSEAGLNILSKTFKKKECSVHGESTHQGESCTLCTAEKRLIIKDCSLHGLTLFQSKSCCKCVSEKSVNIQTCLIHGLTKFRKNKCFKCRESSITQRLCETHGISNYRGGCIACRQSNRFTTEICDEHSETTFIDRVCIKCKSKDYTYEYLCRTHGNSLFYRRTNECLNCLAERINQVKNCETHGESMHKGDRCFKCISDSSYSYKDCELHKNTLFKGQLCLKCFSSKMIQEDFCKIHGQTKFRGESCCKCIVKDSFSYKNCEKHGLANFQADRCCKCESEKIFSISLCDIHGERKFRLNSCCKCSFKELEKRVCEVHGLSKHRLNSCTKCSSMKIAHKRFHKIKINKECPDCAS